MAAQVRDIQFGQNVLASTIEIARHQAESAAALTQTLVGQTQRPQAAFHAWMEYAVTTQERKIQFAQNLFEKGTALLKAHTESVQTLAQALFNQSGAAAKSIPSVARGGTERLNEQPQ